jgi:hypothetical protein
MGITIFAQGRIDRIGDIPSLIDDLQQFAGEHNWNYRIIDDDFDVQPNAIIGRSGSNAPACAIEGSLGLKGIILTIDHGAEPFMVLFDRSGVLTDMMQQVSWISSNGTDERFTACKTQFGNIDSHIGIIELLDSLKKKYITDLAVDDEGAFWETRDHRILSEKRIFLGHCLRQTENVINSIEIQDDDARDAEAIASRIEEALLKADEDGQLPRQ